MTDSSTAYRLARALLFRLPPEAAHAFVMGSLPLAQHCGILRTISGPMVNDPVKVMGLTFANRVGLAAGLDKNAEHLRPLEQIGFGFVEAGTVTPLAQPGNPKPRMFRLAEQQAIINRMGFNNQGVERFTRNLRTTWADAHTQATKPRAVLGLNIGKNAVTPIENATDDYLKGLTAVYPHADYVTVNISSPNTANLRQLQQASELDSMLTKLIARRDQLAEQSGRRVPLLIKIAPDLNKDQVAIIANSIQEHALDGVIATNTTVSREAVAGHRFGNELGGLSGAPVREMSTSVISQLREQLPDNIAIIGVGGIMSAAHALEKFKAGADLVQLYTGLIYQGPALVGQCARAARDYFARNKDAAGATPL